MVFIVRCINFSKREWGIIFLDNLIFKKRHRKWRLGYRVGHCPCKVKNDTAITHAHAHSERTAGIKTTQN